MLTLNKMISEGAFRVCYEHPENPKWCIRVAKKQDNLKVLKLELENYRKVKAHLAAYLTAYEEELVDTDLGLGLVSELLRDDDGKISQPVYQYAENMDSDLSRQLKDFFSILVYTQTFFFDFNLKNFIVRIKDGRKQLKFIDLKSLNKNRSWSFLQMERVIPALAMWKMKRRIKRFYEEISQPYPFEN